MKITYITNINLKEFSGGGSGVNFATFSELKKVFQDLEILQLYSKPDKISKLKSVVLKKLGFKRNYHFFSDRKLRQIAQQFAFQTNKAIKDAYFFHGFTPWIDIYPDKPYYCFNDACFATYVKIYNNRNEFSQNDLKRIYIKETKWLQKAEKVFFRSLWALEETKKAYGINGNNFINVGVGGFIDIPDGDFYKDYDSGQYNFLFISREFRPKGGLTVVNAIKILIKNGLNVKLWIVGDNPGSLILKSKNIEYLGFFNKANPVEKEKLINIFKNAFAIVHPTLKDTNTLVINELAYYGCPAIASNQFAIPEYLIDGKSGYLLINPRDENELAQKMEKMINRKEDYKQMRIYTRKNSINNNTWEKVGKRIIREIKTQKT